MLRAKVFNIVNKLIRQAAPDYQKDTSKDVIEWGAGNLEPWRIIQTVNGSITGRSCIETIRKYIYGSGLNADIDYMEKPNGQPIHINRLHSELSSQVAKLRGVAIWVGWNAGGKIEHLKRLPFEYCRLQISDDNGVIKKIYYNPYWGSADFKDEYTVSYDIYDPSQDGLRSQIKKAGGIQNYKGQIFYASMLDEFNPFYPLPPWWSNKTGDGGGKKWMEIEQKIANFHSHNIDKGFLQNLLLKIIGDPDAPIPEDEPNKAEGKPYRKIGDVFEEEFTNKFSGPEGAKALIMWAMSKDEYPEIDPFPAETNHELFETLQKLTTDNICIATQVPPVLAGVKVSGTLSKDDIENASKLMKGFIQDEKDFLEGVYNELIPKLANGSEETVSIIPYSPTEELIPDPIWNAMSLKEQRDWIRENTRIELEEEETEPAEPMIETSNNGV